MNNIIELQGQPDGYVLPRIMPPDTDFILALNGLASTAYHQRKKRYMFSMWDVKPAVQIADNFSYKVEKDAALQEMERAWVAHRMKLEYYKTCGADMPLEIPGLQTEWEGEPLVLYPFQRAGILYGANAGKYLNGDDMGLGKTAMDICIWLVHRAERGGYLKALIVCPTGVVDTAWRKNFKKFAGMDVTVIEGDLKKRKKIYAGDHEVMVVSYGTFIRDYELIIEAHKAPFFVQDEAHRMADPKSKSTKACFKYIDAVKPEFIIPTSGGFIINKADDIWTFLRMVNPVMAGSYKNFEKRYVKKKPVYVRDSGTGKSKPLTMKYGSGKDGKKQRSWTVMRVSGYQHLDELREKIDPYIVRRLKSEVLTDLPPVSYEQYDIVMGKKEREVYNKLKADFTQAMNTAPETTHVADEDEQMSVFQWLIRAQQICCSMEIYNGDDTKSAKLTVFKEFIRDHADTHKICIFSRFTTMTEILCREFADLNPLHYHGGIAQKDRGPLDEKFQNEQKYRLSISSLKAGGEGRDLYAADIVCFYDQWWAPKAMDQARDRLHRIGQTNPVTCVSFVVKDSIEQRVLEVLERKRAMIANLIKDEDLIKRLPRRILKELI